MAGNKNSGRGPHLPANASRNAARSIAEKQWRKFMSDPDPDDITHPSRMMRIFSEFHRLCVSRGISSHLGLIAAMSQLIGKPVTPVEMEITRSPEDSVNEIFDAIAKLKESETDGAIN